jgi:methionine sulfoxide reductase heme-binding subunit
MTTRVVTIVKVIVFLVSLTPLARLLWRAYGNDLGANPIESITHATGWWALAFLLITLSVTPLRKMVNQPWLIRFRRMLGLFAFFYASLHLVTYLWLDQFFDWQSIAKDIYKRPFITAGFTAWVLMLPLALTSTSWAIRKLGGKRWQLLHRLIYVSAIAGVIHFLWLVKADISEPATFGAILGALLLYRFILLAINRERRSHIAGGRQTVLPKP